MQSDTSGLGALFAVLTALSWSIGMFPSTVAARRLGPASLNFFRLLVAILLLSLATLAFTPVTLYGLFFSPHSEHWVWLGASGAVGLALGDFFGFSAFTRIGTRITSVFNTLSPAAALFFGFFINGERLNSMGLAGMAITIAGIIWLNLGKGDKDKDPRNNPADFARGVTFAILAALCQGIGVALSQRGLQVQIAGEKINAIHASLIRMIVAAASVMLLALFTGRLRHITQPFMVNKDKGLSYAFAGTLFGPVIGMIFCMQAIALSSASIAQTILSLVPVFVLVIAHFVNKDRITFRSLSGALIAILGVVILIWRDALTHLLFG